MANLSIESQKVIFLDDLCYKKLFKNYLTNFKSFDSKV